MEDHDKEQAWEAVGVDLLLDAAASYFSLRIPLARKAQLSRMLFGAHKVT